MSDEAHSEAAPAEPAGERPRRRWLGRALALLAGVAIVCLAELLLAAFGYGGPPEIFIRTHGPGGEPQYVTNMDAFRRTFLGHRVLRAKDFYVWAPVQRFAARKPPGTCRLAVVGASAVKGFPYPVNASFPLLLETILRAVTSGRQVEVINVGVPALSSLSVMARAEEVLGYGVDLLVVYCGHNEFFGVYGAASGVPLSSRRPVARLQMWMRERRLSLLLSELIGAVLPEPPPEELRKSLSEILPERTDVRHGAETYERTLASYRANLEDIVAAARRRQVPVVLCTLGANLRDYPPLGSAHGPELTEVERSRWREQFRAGRDLLEAGDPGAAAPPLAEAAELDPGHAEGRFLLARCQDALRRLDEARPHYEAARDLDTVRWRIAGDFNAAVRDVAREAADPEVVLADADAHLRALAEGGLPGYGLFLEHVHPTAMGNAAVAEAVALALRDSIVAGRLGQWDWSRHAPLKSYLEANGVDALDRYFALRNAAHLYAGPLSAGFGAERRVEELHEQADALIEGADAARREAFAATRRAGYHEGRGDRYDLVHVAVARQYAARGDYEAALREIDKVRRYGTWQLLNNSYANVFAAEGRVRLMMGEAAAARRLATEALELNADSVSALQLMADALTATGDAFAAAEWAERARQARQKTQQKSSPKLPAGQDEI